MQVDEFVESARDERACECGCGKRWLLSRGRLGATAVVAMPTVHDERVAWLALRIGDDWVCLRSWLQGDNVAAGIAERSQSPIGALVAPVLTRAQVIADQHRKSEIFAIHDALMKAHPDLRHLFDPDRGRDYSFQMPDCMFELPPEQRTRHNQNFAEQGERRFVRALLPIPIGDGTELRVGVWIEVSPDAFAALRTVWKDEAAYMQQRLTGPIESSMVAGGSDVRGAIVTLAPRQADQCLFVAESATPWLAALMRDGVSIRDYPRFVGELQASLKRRA